MKLAERLNQNSFHLLQNSCDHVVVIHGQSLARTMIVINRTVDIPIIILTQ